MTSSQDERHWMRFSLEVTFETPVNIGGYGAPTFVDRPFRRDTDGWPFIPATSLKGRLRHECERLARALGDTVCNGPDPTELCKDGGAGQNDGEAQPEVCPICRIFGSPWIEGRMYPADLMLVRPPELGKQIPASDTRYNVSISRRRRVAEDARLFTTELFLPGIPLTFTGLWEGDLSWRELVLVEAGLGAITALGRAKTAGLGWCAIHIQSTVFENEGWRSITEEERAQGRAQWRR